LKNSAKCKLCQSIIESFHLHDHVSCKCGEISISGGLQEYKVMCNDWNNFLRVDDMGNEIIVTVKDEEKLDVKPLYIEKPTREDKLKMLDEMIKSYENLPSHAIQSPVTGYDLVSALLLVKSILES